MGHVSQAQSGGDGKRVRRDPHPIMSIMPQVAPATERRSLNAGVTFAVMKNDASVARVSRNHCRRVGFGGNILFARAWFTTDALITSTSTEHTEPTRTRETSGCTAVQINQHSAVFRTEGGMRLRVLSGCAGEHGGGVTHSHREHEPQGKPMLSGFESRAGGSLDPTCKATANPPQSHRTQRSQCRRKPARARSMRARSSKQNRKAFAFQPEPLDTPLGLEKQTLSRLSEPWHPQTRLTRAPLCRSRTRPVDDDGREAAGYV